MKNTEVCAAAAEYCYLCTNKFVRENRSSSESVGANPYHDDSSGFDSPSVRGFSPKKLI